MTMMATNGLTAPEDVTFRRYRPDLHAALRKGEVQYPCIVTEVSATGVLVDLGPRDVCPDPPQSCVVVIPSLGQYKARRAWRDGTRAAYLFELTEFSIRALDALLRDRFADVP